jgi:hypothetical protein
MVEQENVPARNPNICTACSNMADGFEGLAASGTDTSVSREPQPGESSDELKRAA